MNALFQNDGPGIIPDENYHDFVQLCHDNPSFDELFHLWLNENHPDGLRRLSLRNLLRQPTTPDQSPTPSFFYRTRHDASRFFCIDDCDSTELLRHTFANRPKLRKEFWIELDYALQNQPICPTGSAAQAYDLLIELLLPLLPEYEGRFLWEHHSLQDQTDELSQRLSLRLWLPDAQAPHWLRAEIESSLRQRITDQLDVLSRTYEDPTQPHFVFVYHFSSLLAQIADLTLIHDTEAHLANATACLNLLEDLLPANVYYYADYLNLVNLLPKLTDDRLILKISRRTHHASSRPNAPAYVHTGEHLRAYYRLLAWLTVLCHDLTPDDTVYLEILNTLRQKILS